MPTIGEDEQDRAFVTPGDRLEWQSELDSAPADLDSRLSHPRPLAAAPGDDAVLELSRQLIALIC